MSIFKDLNEVQLNLNEYEEIPLSELEEKQIIQRTQKKLNCKQSIKIKKNKYTVTAAASFVAALFITFTIAFPTFAEKFSFTNIFDFFTNNEQYIFEEYDEYATPIGQVAEDNGIKITINKAVYDKENITIAYTINSEEYLGERPVLLDDITVEELGLVNEDHIYSRKFIVEKINDYEYAVLYVFNFSFYDSSRVIPETVNISWRGDNVTNLKTPSNFYKTTKGNWNFEFSLQLLENDVTNYVANDVITTDTGIEIGLSKITQSPISTTFYLNEKVDERIVSKEEKEMRFIEIEYLVSDNLGNEYGLIHIRGTGHSTDFGTDHINDPQIITNRLHEDASYIYITPIINVLKVDNPDVNGDGTLVPVMEPFQIEPVRVPLNDKP